MGRTKRRRRWRKNKGLPNPDNSPTIIELKKWMHKNKWKNQALLKLAMFKNTGRGLTSSRNIGKLDILIEVPYNIMITYTTLESSPYFKTVLSSNCEKLTMQDLLTLFLILEQHKGGASSWKPYVDSLPKSNPPVSWLSTIEEIEKIFDDELKTKTERCLESFEMSWQRLSSSLNPKWLCECCGCDSTSIITFVSFTWAYLMVNTRSVYVDPDLVCALTVKRASIFRILSNKPSMALCPYLDMFNHSCHATTQIKLENKDGEWIYKLTTSTSFQKYDELFISYGDHDNYKLLCEYGFFIPDKSLEKVKFKLSEILQVCKFSPSTRQITFIQAKCFDDNMEMYAKGSSFNLQASLYVLAKPNDKDWSTAIFNRFGFPENFPEVCEHLKCLIAYRINSFSTEITKIENIEGEKTESFCLILSYLKFKLDFMRDILTTFNASNSMDLE